MKRITYFLFLFLMLLPINGNAQSEVPDPSIPTNTKLYHDLGVIRTPEKFHIAEDTSYGNNTYKNKNNDIKFTFVVYRPTVFCANFNGSHLEDVNAYLLRAPMDESPYQNVGEPVSYEMEELGKSLQLERFMNYYIEERLNHGWIGTLFFQVLEPGYYVLFCEGADIPGKSNDGYIKSNIYINPIGTDVDQRLNIDINTILTGAFEEDADQGLYCALEFYKPTDIQISTKGTQTTNLSMSIMDAKTGNIVADSKYFPAEEDSFPQIGNTQLKEGNYLLDVTFEGIAKLNLNLTGQLNILEGDSNEKPFIIDLSPEEVDYQKTFDTSDYLNDSGHTLRKDLYHQIEITRPMDIVISCPSCEMKDGAMIVVIDNYYQEIASFDTREKNEIRLTNLEPGFYYIISEGNLQDGKMTLRVQASGHYACAASADRNYITTIIPTVPVATAATLKNPSKAQRQTDYYDLLGRPEQTVKYAVSPQMHDLVTHTEYDGLGRESRKWLPIVHEMSAAYVPTEAVKNSASALYSDEFAYQQSTYEDSPSSRIVESYGPGEAWHQAERCNTKGYFMDGKDDKCQLFTVEGTRELPTLINQGLYSDGIQYYSGELQMTRTADEDGHASIQFKDKRGLLVLERQPADGDTLETYYVYDDFENLCFVLPPMAVDTLLTNSTIGNVTGSSMQSMLDRYAYQYRYDQRNRCIGKKLPGCEWTEMIYDHADRLLFTQDGEQRKRNEWTAIFSDRLGRSAITALYTGPINRAQYEQVSVYAIFMPDNTVTYYGYNIQGLPFANSLLKPLQVSYYDTYAFKHCCPEFPASLDYEEDSDFDLRNGTDKDSPMCKGLATGSMTAVLDSDQKLFSATYYDFHQHPVQVRSTSVNGTVIVYKSSFNFSGQPVKEQEKYGSSTLFGKYTTYDHAGRRTEETNGLYSGKPCTASFKYTYDELGRVTRMNRSDGSNSFPTENEYNIRNWLTKTKSTYFEQNLNYTDGLGTPCYNGNISSMTNTLLDILESPSTGYKFTYDGLSRLKDAIYGVGNTLSDIDNRNYSEQIGSYDKHGNIQSLKRFGLATKGSYGMTDNLTLSYNGNQLTAVDDKVSSAIDDSNMEFKDGTKQAIEYRYDTNGNLTQDLNKKITNIQYNCLNLPSRVQFEGGNNIAYLYDAIGTKLRVTHQIDGVTTTTDYCGNAIYENGVIDKLLTSQGYISLADAIYHYYLQDYQGNNRVVMYQDGSLEELNDYYPLGGLSLSLGDTQPYKYNGKEFDAKGGLNLYDYGARQYDPALGRWHVTDPMSEKHYGISPYTYCANNPVKNIDPDGRDWRISTHYNDETKKIEYQMTVNAVLYNNSSNPNIDMNQLATSITQQINSVYNISESSFVTKMNFNLRVVNSIDEIGERDHVIRTVDQQELDAAHSNKKPGAVAADARTLGLDIRISTETAENLINGTDKRTAAHELGHTGGLHDLTKKEEGNDRLMMQAIKVYDSGGIPDKALRLPQSSIMEIRNNYINNKLNHDSPVKTWFGKKYLSR